MSYCPLIYGCQPGDTQVYALVNTWSVYFNIQCTQFHYTNKINNNDNNNDNSNTNINMYVCLSPQLIQYYTSPMSVHV